MQCFRKPIFFFVSALVMGLSLWGSGAAFSDSFPPFPSGQKKPELVGPQKRGSDSPVPREAVWTESHSGKPSLYDLKLRLEVDGRIKLFSKTRYYRSEDLHLKLEARSCPEGWDFRSLRLVENTGEINFGIGEGPKKHQRYILLTNPPSARERSLIQQQVQRIERTRGCDLEQKPSGGGSKKCRARHKRGYFNYYLWGDATGTFGFVMSPRGECLSVENGAELNVWSKEGGKSAKPRFFETLEYALLAVSAFTDDSWQSSGGKVPGRWEMDCEEIMKGLVGFAKGVYGRKMVLLDPEGLKRQRVLYTAHRLPGTTLLRIRGVLATTECTPVRISGFKGRIWIESFSRETYLDVEEGRILKDELEISFGVERKKKIFYLDGTKNTVHISLVDHCVLKCPDTEDAIRMAYLRCIPPLADM
jgi:hypothetical protein